MFSVWETKELCQLLNGKINTFYQDIIVREGPGYQIGWIFGKTPNGLRTKITNQQTNELVGQIKILPSDEEEGCYYITNNYHLIRRGVFMISNNWWNKKSCHLMRRRVVCCKWLQIVLQTKSSLLHNLKMSRVQYVMVWLWYSMGEMTIPLKLVYIYSKNNISELLNHIPRA